MTVAQNNHAWRAVSVLIQRDAAPDAWGLPRWQVVGVLPEPGQAPERPTRSLARDGDQARVFLWRGLKLRLNPESCYDYWLNLSSDKPLLFVICQPDTDGDLRPVTVSADQDDGVAALEVEETVFEAVMPPPIAAWVEQYAYDNWRPGPHKKKGKRRKPLDNVP